MQPDDSHAAVKERILAAAMDAIVDVGVVDLHLEEVGRRAGLPPGEVLHYFHSRQRLMLATLRWHEERIQSDCQAAMSLRASARERLSCFLDYYLPSVDDSAKWVVWLQVWAVVATERELEAWRQRVVTQWRRLLADIIDRGVRRGEMVCGDGDRFAAAFLAVLDGLSIHAMSDPPFIDCATGRALAWEYAAVNLGWDDTSETSADPRQAGPGSYWLSRTPAGPPSGTV